MATPMEEDMSIGKDLLASLTENIMRACRRLDKIDEVQRVNLKLESELESFIAEILEMNPEDEAEEDGANIALNQQRASEVLKTLALGESEVLKTMPLVHQLLLEMNPEDFANIALDQQRESKVLKTFALVQQLLSEINPEDFANIPLDQQRESKVLKTFALVQQLSLEMNPEDEAEEDGDNIDLDSQRKRKVLKALTWQMLEMNPEEGAEEDGANIDLDSKRKRKVLKTSTQQILEMNPEDEAEEDGANIDLDSQRKRKVLKTSTQPILEMNPEDEAEEDGANIDLDSKRTRRDVTNLVKIYCHCGKVLEHQLMENVLPSDDGNYEFQIHCCKFLHCYQRIESDAALEAARGTMAILQVSGGVGGTGEATDEAAGVLLGIAAGEEVGETAEGGGGETAEGGGAGEVGEATEEAVGVLFGLCNRGIATGEEEVGETAEEVAGGLPHGGRGRRVSKFWSTLEDEKLITGVTEFKRSWVQIKRKYFTNSTRSADELRNRWDRLKQEAQGCSNTDEKFMKILFINDN